MKVVHTIKDLQAELAVLRAQGKTCRTRITGKAQRK